MDNFIFCAVVDVLWKCTVSTEFRMTTKFPHQEIRWDFDILRYGISAKLLLFQPSSFKKGIIPFFITKQKTKQAL